MIGQVVDTCVLEKPDKWDERKGVIKLIFCGEGIGEDHRSAAVGQHVESRDQDGGAGQCAERQHCRRTKSSTQGGDNVPNGREELDIEMTCRHSRRRVECVGHQVSASDERKLRVPCASGSDDNLDVRREGVVQMKDQLRNRSEGPD